MPVFVNVHLPPNLKCMSGFLIFILKENYHVIVVKLVT